ncbi:S1 family peptidase [Streptomyces uncialis]|uniref:S1 family peptidase n=1 Tax=Streptomyces uncialis TaxID=1048205 RepID=UPI0022569CBC|nr:S1 family peptidase [Streptomyces uncialis]MCX4662935.1 S1 family peptidase [Streptomyces uncialis]
MTHRRIPKRRAALAGAGVLALVAGAATFQSANASTERPLDTPKTLSAVTAGKLSKTLSRDLGADAAGSYYDSGTRQLVVNVVDKASVRTVEAAGAKARLVENSLAELRSARTTLTDRASIPGTSWAVDPTTNKVVVTADRTVRGAELNKLNRVLEGLGGTVELQRSTGEFKPFAAGGDTITSGGGRCSLGFNVVRDGQPFFLTAGHCTNGTTAWSDSSGQRIGQTAESSFPGDDYGLVRYESGVAHPSEVNLYNGATQPIARAGDATVGMQVVRSGSTTQVHEGAVTGLDATVNYGNGDVVNGLVQTDVCAEPGDSGGSLFSGDTAIGLTSGGSGNCSAGGTTFFQPVTEALQVLGAQIG